MLLFRIHEAVYFTKYNDIKSGTSFSIILSRDGQRILNECRFNMEFIIRAEQKYIMRTHSKYLIILLNSFKKCNNEAIYHKSE
jgi:hypothetical protein